MNKSCSSAFGASFLRHSSFFFLKLFSAVALSLNSFLLSPLLFCLSSVSYHLCPTLQCVVADDSMLQAVLCLLACLRNLFYLLKVLALGFLNHSRHLLCLLPAIAPPSLSLRVTFLPVFQNFLLICWIFRHVIRVLIL